MIRIAVGRCETILLGCFKVFFSLARSEHLCQLPSRPYSWTSPVALEGSVTKPVITCKTSLSGRGRLGPSRTRSFTQHPRCPAGVKAWCQVGQAVSSTSPSQAEVPGGVGAKLDPATDWKPPSQAGRVQIVPSWSSWSWRTSSQAGVEDSTGVEAILPHLIEPSHPIQPWDLLTITVCTLPLIKDWNL